MMDRFNCKKCTNSNTNYKRTAKGANFSSLDAIPKSKN